MTHFRTCLMTIAALAITTSAGSAAMIYFEESGGQVVMEAENFQNSTASAANTWQVLNTGFSNFRGDGFIQANPDIANSNGGSPDDPTVEYNVKIDTTGTYDLFHRSLAGDGGPAANSGFSNSFWSNVVEVTPAAVRDDTGSGNDFATTSWLKAGSWTISTAGFYTVRISMREDGAAIDTLILQLDSLGNPTGNGPAESPIVIPEPASVALFGLGGLLMLKRRDRRTSA